MKLLVTGGAGFIGSNFVRYWLETYKDDEIVNLDVLTYAGNLANLKEYESDPRYSFVKGDICDAAVVEKAIQGVDMVVHFAAETHVDRSIMDSAPFLMTNIMGTKVLLDAALKHNVTRFHHISTDEVFGALPLDTSEKFSEMTPYNPHSPYSASKASSDMLVRAYGTTYGLRYTISNCSNNYGPYMFPEKLFSVAITNLLEGKKVPIYGDGLYVRDWLYVEDHVKAIDLILKNGRDKATYCVGGLKDDVANIDAIKMILRIMGKDDTELEYVKDRPGHDRRYAVDWTKINQELGWEPAMTFEQGLQKTVDWYTQNQDWWKNIKTGAYQEYYDKQYHQR